MGQKYLMAIDAGTGSVRAVLFDTEGNQIGVSQQEWFHREDPRWPGSMDFDWTHNWELASGCVRDVLADTGIDPAEIAAVSTTCMREGIVLYDENKKEIWACANVDSRSTDEVAQLVRMNPDLEREIYRKSGETYALGAIPRVMWVKNKMPEVYEKIRYLGMFNDWLIYRLTGVLAVEPSNGSTTGMM
ncbi:MAG: autoinducer-2 kinase, partial [Clostridia bacterium]|nr:autoinducer-2 kinase [Clostridia bacterium]